MRYIIFTPKTKNVVPVWNFSKLDTFVPHAEDYSPLYIVSAQSAEEAFALADLDNNPFRHGIITLAAPVCPTSGDVVVREDATRYIQVYHPVGVKLLEDTGFLPLAQEVARYYPASNPKDPAPNSDELALLAAGHKIQAIKSHRARTGYDLKQSKDIFDAEELTQTARKEAGLV